MTSKKEKNSILDLEAKVGKLTGYDEFNLPVPKEFPKEGMTSRAAHAIVQSECWTDANPMLNLSSFVTTFASPKRRDLRVRSFRNFADPTCIHTRRRRNSSACDGCTISGMARRTPSPTELRPLVPPRPACWAASPTSGTGGRLGIRREKMPVGRTW